MWGDSARSSTADSGFTLSSCLCALLFFLSTPPHLPSSLFVPPLFLLFVPVLPLLLSSLHFLSLQPIRNNNPWMLLFFISFLLIVSFFVLNMFVGVVVENFHKCRQQQEEEEARLREEKRQRRLEKRRRSERTRREGRGGKTFSIWPKVCGHLNIPLCDFWTCRSKALTWICCYASFHSSRNIRIFENLTAGFSLHSSKMSSLQVSDFF